MCSLDIDLYLSHSDVLILTTLAPAEPHLNVIAARLRQLPVEPGVLRAAGVAVTLSIPEGVAQVDDPKRRACPVAEIVVPHKRRRTSAGHQTLAAKVQMCCLLFVVP